MNDVIGIAVEKWSAEDYNTACKWLHDMYGDPCAEGNSWYKQATWYVDHQPLCQDLIMRKDIYFMFVAAFGEDYGRTSYTNTSRIRKD